MTAGMLSRLSLKPKRTPSNSNLNEDSPTSPSNNSDFSPSMNNNSNTSSNNQGRRTASSPTSFRNSIGLNISTKNDDSTNLSPSKRNNSNNKLSRESSSSSLRSMITLNSPESNNNNNNNKSKYLAVGGTGSNNVGNLELLVGEGNLTLDRIGPVGTFVQPPELLIAEASPVLPSFPDTDEDSPHRLRTRSRAASENSFTEEGEEGEDLSTTTTHSTVSTPPVFHHAASYDNSNTSSGQFRSTSLPPLARARAATVSDSIRPSGLLALAGINGSPLNSNQDNLNAPTGSSASMYNGKSAAMDNSRPTSRSGSVNSQQYPDSLHPTSASSSRKNTLLSPSNSSSSGQTPIYENNSNASSSTSFLAGVSRNMKKTKSNSGIASALALSGVALASPINSLRQPLSLVGRGQSYTSISNSNLSNNNSTTTSPTATRNSHDYTNGDSDSTYDHGNGRDRSDSGNGFMSMDQLGDFDDVVNQLGSGYAVASSKRNNEFHSIFKNIQEDDYLIEDYGCAMQREILIQGRLYISEHHLSFNANIFGWVTSVTLPFAEVVSIEKRMTAYVIPNAIQVTTLHARHTFASFLSRDTTYDLIVNIWRMVHPVVPTSAALPDSASHLSRNSYQSNSNEDSPIEESGESGLIGSNSNTKRILLNRSQNSRNGNNNGNSTGMEKGSSGGNVNKMHAPTVDRCPDYKNLKETCMDTIFPSAPEKIYNLMYTSGFMKEFWSNTQKLLELQISDWAPEKSGSNNLSRSISYIKPLNGSIGPRQTKCYLVDENAHVDFDDYVTVITSTRTPDVPNGGSFTVKTRTSMTWAKGNSCRVVVTTGVEWSKSSFLKGIIERSVMEGQRSSYVDLEKSMRAYIHQHRSEFLEEGQEVDNASITDTSSIISNREGQTSSSSNSNSKKQEFSNNNNKNNNDDNPAPSLRTGEGKIIPYLRPFIEFGTMIFDLISDLIGGLTITSGSLGFIVIALVLSNLWTLSSRPQVPSRLNSSSSSSIKSDSSILQRASNQRTPDEVATAVRSVLQDYFAGLPGNNALPVLNSESSQFVESALEVKVNGLNELLEKLEERLTRLEESVKQNQE